MAKEIELTFFDDGNSQVEAHGYSGKGCKAATEEIEKLLGKSGFMKKKKEYFKGLVKGAQTRLTARG